MFSRGSSSKSLGSSSSQSPSRHQHPLSSCADCGAQGPTWASINRGVLLCAACTSAHRSLGRHVSQVKSLRAGHWIPEQLTMVQSLYSCGANSIWEYSLLNPGGGSKSGSGGGRLRKPSSSDPLHPTKSDFIAAKYAQLSFVYRPGKDEPATSESELSRQLHSSVRTPNLETSLRLISQGADPNYFHPEKNSTPLQVAARAGQACQVELLLVYGADPGALDKTGRTAAEYARQAGHTGLASRITVAQYEVSDRLSFFLSQRRPDHSTGEHFLVPEVDHDRSSDDRKVAKRKLQGLNNAVFEELAMDVYDEVDRRETDEVWAKVETSSSIVPFLPVNPDYGTTRNQGRQKLARLSRQEFAVLVMDVLKEIRRRQTDMDSCWPKKQQSPLRETPLRQGGAKTKSLPVPKAIAVGALSDDEPIYDHVASDDDYYHIPTEESKNSVNSSPSKNNSSSSKPKGNELSELRAQLENSEVKVQRLIESNDDMRSEIARLSATVNKLVSENEQLKMSLSPKHSYNNVATSVHQPEVNRGSPLRLFEPPSGLPVPPNYLTLPSKYLRGENNSFSFTPPPPPPAPISSCDYVEPRKISSTASSSSSSSSSAAAAAAALTASTSSLPSQEEVVRRTEAITRCIQELLISAKDEKFEAFIPCSERIVRAVTDMVLLFPEEPLDGGISAALSSLTAAATHFETECRVLIARSQSSEPLQQSFVTHQVIQCAFDIAKSTKQLVALFQ